MRTPLVTLIITAFLINTLGPLPVRAEELFLPKPGVMVHLSPAFNPPVLKGITVHPDNPFKFDFILDKGEARQSQEQLTEESVKLVKYFLAAITTPEKDLWVNLSPYEKDRIIPESFGQTDMGRDLLVQDYLLKQITASLIYPEEAIGQQFWKRVYEEAAKKFGTTNIPVNTFNKVWIVPERAKVYERGNTAFVVNAKLKVMLEEDYLALEKNRGHVPEAEGGRYVSQDSVSSSLGSQIVREIVIPQLEKEVNENKNFAPLRQVYNSLVLAVWFKKRMKDRILGHKYMDQNKVAGIDIDDKEAKQKIYEQYLKAFKKGVYNYIKEEVDPLTQEMMPRKYFSGGATMSATMRITEFVESVSNGEVSTIKQMVGVVGVTVDLARERSDGQGSFAMNVIDRPTNAKLARIKEQLSKVPIEEVLIRSKAYLFLLSLKKELKEGGNLEKVYQYLSRGFITLENIVELAPEIEQLMFQQGNVPKYLMDILNTMNKKGIRWQLSPDLIVRMTDRIKDAGYDKRSVEDLMMLRTLMQGQWFQEKDIRTIRAILVDKDSMGLIARTSRADKLLGLAILEELVLMGILDQKEIEALVPRVFKIVFNNSYSSEGDIKWRYLDDDQYELLRRAVGLLDSIAKKGWKWQVGAEDFLEIERLIEDQSYNENLTIGLQLLEIIVRYQWHGERLTEELLEQISNLPIREGDYNLRNICILLREQGYSVEATPAFKARLKQYGIFYTKRGIIIDEAVFKDVSHPEMIGPLKDLLSSMMMSQSDVDQLFEQMSESFLNRDRDLRHAAIMFWAHISDDQKEHKSRLSKRAIKALMTVVLSQDEAFFRLDGNLSYLVDVTRDNILEEEDRRALKDILFTRSNIARMIDADIVRLWDRLEYTGTMDYPNWESREMFIRETNVASLPRIQFQYIDALRLAVRMKKINREDAVRLLYKFFTLDEFQVEIYSELIVANDSQYKGLLDNLDFFILNGFQLKMFNKDELLKLIGLFREKVAHDTGNAQRWAKLINQISVQSLDADIYREAYDALLWLADRGFIYAEQLLEGQVRSVLDGLKLNVQRALTEKERALINVIQRSRRQASLMPLLTGTRFDIADRFLILKVLAEKGYIDPEYQLLSQGDAPRVFHWMDQIYQEFKVVPPLDFLDQCRSSGGGCIAQIKAVKPQLEDLVKTRNYKKLVSALSNNDDMMLAYYLLYPSPWKYQGVMPMNHQRFKESITEVNSLLSAQIDVGPDLIAAYQKVGLNETEAREMVDLLMQGDMPIKKNDPIRQKLDGKGIWAGQDQYEGNVLRKQQARESYDDLRQRIAKSLRITDEINGKLKPHEQWFKSDEGKWLWDMSIEEAELHLAGRLDLIKKSNAQDAPSLVKEFSKEMGMSKLMDILWRQLIADINPPEVDQLIDYAGHISMAWDNYHTVSNRLSNQKIYVKPIYKFDLMQFLKFADGGHCCLTSDPKIGDQFGNAWQHVLEYMADTPHFFWQVVTEDGQQVGWYENWLGIDQDTGKPMVGTELLYLAPDYQEVHIQEGILNAVHGILLNQGISYVGQLVPIYRPSNALMPPQSFVDKQKNFKKLQSVNIGESIYEDHQVPTNLATVQNVMVDSAKESALVMSASLSASPAMDVNQVPGGIDLTADRMNLDVEGNGAMVAEPMDLQALEHIEINALYIEKIEIRPLTNLLELLGVN